MNVSIRKAALSALLPVLLCFAPLAAHAATTTFTFTGQNPTGNDPLGGVYVLSSQNDGINNFLEGAGEQPDPTQQVLFNPAAGGLLDATSFTLTETGTTDKLIKASDFGVFFQTFQPGGNIISTWTATENAAGTSVTFTAPNAADDLLAGERFDLDVSFKNPIPNGFTYTLTWGGAAVPEPATWAMMIAGLGMIGGVLRRKNALGVAAA